MGISGTKIVLLSLAPNTEKVVFSNDLTMIVSCCFSLNLRKINESDGFSSLLPDTLKILSMTLLEFVER